MLKNSSAKTTFWSLFSLYL